MYNYKNRIIREHSSAKHPEGSGEHLSIKEYKYNAFHCIEARSNDVITKYRYHFSGVPYLVIQHGINDSESHPLARRTELIYDTQFRISQKKTWYDLSSRDYFIEQYQYNLADAVVEKQIQDAEGNINLRKCFAYNDSGRVIEEYYFDNGHKFSTVQTSYNAFGEPISYKDDLGTETVIHIHYEHINTLGQKVLKKTIVNPLGCQTEIEFDALGRISHISKKDSMGILLASQQFLYDALGNRSKEINEVISDGIVIDAQATHWKHGPLGRLEEKINGYGSSMAQKSRYSYNQLGQVIEQWVSGFAAPLIFEYSPIGQLKTVKYQDPKRPREEHIYYAYIFDGQSNLIKATNNLVLGNGQVERKYDTFDQIIEEKVWDGSGQYTSSYTYDLIGRIKSIVLPDGSAISYSYKGIFCHQIKRMDSQGKELYSHAYNSYDENGRIRQEQLLDGSFRSNAYDCNGRTIETVADYFTEKCAYNPLGALLEQKIRGNLPSQHNLFSYDTSSHLVSEQSTKVKNYKCDSLHNRLQNNKDTLLYNALNQLISCGEVKYSYDEQGNLAYKLKGQERTNFESNILAQISKIEKPEQLLLQFIHDPIGRRIVKKCLHPRTKKAISTERYIYFGHQEIGVMDENKVIQALRIPGMKGTELSTQSICIELKNKPFLPLHSSTANLIALVDLTTLTVAESYTYTAFGEETIFDSSGNVINDSLLGNPWRYAEKHIDKETKLLFFGRRYYDPEIGRWLTPDPWGNFDGANLYSYLHHNPLNSIDPLGLAAEDSSVSKFEHFFYSNVEVFRSCWGKPPNQYCLIKKITHLEKDSSSRLPRIQYDDQFEQLFSITESSRLFHIAGPISNPQIGIGFICGIGNKFKDAEASARYLSQLSGGYNIHGVYNASLGPRFDFIKFLSGLDFVATTPVRLLHQQWNQFFATAGPDAKFLQIGHSLGVLMIRNGLLDYPEELRKRIIVIAVAPAGYVYQRTCAKVTHYTAPAHRDFIPLIDREGLQRERETVVELASHPDAELFDHAFMSPTYEGELKRRLLRYVNHYKGNP